MKKTIIIITLGLLANLASAQDQLSLQEIEKIDPYEVHDYSKYKSFTALTEQVHPDSIYSLLFHYQKDFPIGFGKLKNLQSVAFYACEELDYKQIIKECMKLKNLTSLTISGISKQAFPEKLYKLESLKKLILAGNTFNTIPPGLQKLKNLEVLYLGDHLSGGNKVLTFPKEILKLEKLRELCLTGNMEIELGDSFYQLNSLEALNVSFIKNLDFKRMCNSFPNLKRLEITSIGKPSWDGISKLENLEELCMDYDLDLISLGNDFSNLKRLRKLTIDFDKQLYSKDEIEKIAALPNLQELTIHILGDSTELLFPTDGFESLQVLRIYDGPKASIRRIIKLIPNYPRLEKLDLYLNRRTLTSEEENELLELSKSIIVVGLKNK